MGRSDTQLFELEPETKSRGFTIVRGAIPEPVVDDAIPADQIQGSEWDPQDFAELDGLVAMRAALARHNREVAKARLSDAERYEAQIDGLLRKYQHLVPQPLQGKAWKETTGEFSGGKYRYQPQRAPKYEFEDKEQAKAAGLTATYEVLKVDLQAVKSFETSHPNKPIPGIRRTDPCAVSFKPIEG